MKVILLQTYETLGQVGEVVNVKPGYARNYLFPKKIAQIATDANVKSLESWLKQEEIKEAKSRENKELLVKYLNKLTLKFELKAGENEKLFGSVTSQMISDEIEKLGYGIDKKELILVDALKTIGNHFVEVDLGSELKAKIKIKISAAK